MLMADLPFDPVLAAVYAQVGFDSFVTDVVGLIVRRYDDTARKVEEDNQWWSQGYRKQLALPTFIFAGEPLMAYHYATVPALADERGWQPVVRVDVYEDPYALPIASSVDQLFETYSRYLEALMARPDARQEKGTALTFPWDVPEIIARDVKLLERLRSGHFDPFMPGVEERAWVRKVLAAATTRV
jgi:hypothetical protein